MELLAPAGNLEAGVAAFKYGADAVYLGLQNFSARADADNFSFDDLATLLGLAHNNPEWPRKVYVAVNTLVREKELPELIDTLARLRDLEPDAIIVQDWAVFQIVQEYFPEFVLHASTQLAIHNVQGAIMANEIGFTRVVAARELTVPEITEIAQVPNLEIEVFIHGALCYSYSGLCQLSAMLRGESGNRGECAYICRKKYNIVGEKGPCEACNVMSMKDLAAGDIIASLRKAKVASLKIEGRKKTPLYVAAVTNYYRNLIDNTFDPGEQQQCEADIKTIFSRPWTPFHLRNRRQAGVTDVHFVGHRGIVVGKVTDVVAGQPDRIRFTVKNRPLERHDGLQIELPGRDKPYGFPINDIRLFAQKTVESWSSVFEAAPEDTIEVSLPDDHPDIPINAKIACSSSQKVKQSYSWEMPRPAQCRERFPVYFKLSIRPTELTVLAQPCAGPRELEDVKTVMQMDPPLEPAKDPERLDQTLKECFSRLGDTTFTLADLRVDNPEQLFVPTSILNELRRRSTEDVQEALDNDFRSITSKVIDSINAWKPALPSAATQTKWSIKIDKIFFLNLFTPEDLQKVDEVVFSLERTPLEELEETLDELVTLVGSLSKIRLSIPPIIRNDLDDTIDSVTIEELYRRGWRRWEVSNIGSFQLLKDAHINLQNLNLTADWQLYVTNRLAAKAIMSLGCQRVAFSPADNWQNWSDLLRTLAPVSDVIVYQDTPLAISDVCINASLKGFCPGKSVCDFHTMKLNTFDDNNLLAINNNCQSVIINAQPFCLGGKIVQLHHLGVTHFRADFIWRDYAPKNVLQIWNDLMQDREIPDTWMASMLS
ncbi:MAG: U32 family peptidase [Lentisphaeria bacterium]|nr:U32 family peptidase [Lentisphaeria bacterium]